MSKCKLVPVDPTIDMIVRLMTVGMRHAEYVEGGSPALDEMKQGYAAMLAAAPEVEQEPVADVCMLRGQPIGVPFLRDGEYSLKAGQKLYARPQSARCASKLVEALERLVFAAQCRDNSTGCQIRLIETRAELSAAVNNAEEALSAYRQQGGDA